MFTNLQKLNLANNTITDITPIRELTKITSLDLSDNKNINIYDQHTEECFLPNKVGLKELNLSNTQNSNIEFISQLENIEILNLSKNGIGSTEPLKNLHNIKKLNLSGNPGIQIIDDILGLSSLNELDISLTGIKSLLHSASSLRDENPYGIAVLGNLINLNIEGNALDSIDPILYYYEDTRVEIETDEDGKEIEIVIKYNRAYLENLQQLNLNYTGKNKINYGALILLKNLTHLSMKGNELDKINNQIVKLKNLQYINLSDNLLTNIDSFVRIEEELRTFWDDNGNPYKDYVEVPHYLTATTIELAHNKITDISLLSAFDHNIEYLNLSQNAVYDIEILESSKFKEVNLREQGCGWETPNYYMPIKDKKASVNQYIILPSLFQNSKREGSKFYDENANFTVSNIELNNDEAYHVPGFYNVIIGYEKTKDDELKVTLHGGRADGSTLYFKISTDKNSIDSSIFNDSNLITAISDEINKMGYNSRNALKIINVESYVFNAITTLNLNKYRITDITGLASFENLEYLYLADNNISSIAEIKESGNLKELYLSNNQNLKDVTPIENMVQLEKLDLENTGITNIDSVNKLIKNMDPKNKKQYTLEYLNLSNNSIKDINGVEVITTLEELRVSNIDIKDISKLSTLINLAVLDVSQNRIEDLEPLRGLKNLKYLYVGNNNIEDIKPISGITLSTLDFSGNRVKDITSLSNGYSNLIMDSNLISDISCLNSFSYKEFSMENQKLTYGVEQGRTGEIRIELPALLLQAQQNGSKVYSEKEFLLTNCSLTADKKAVMVNVEDLKNQIATVQINGGKAYKTTFSIAEPLEGTITYEPSNEIPTNKDIKVSITFNRENVTITNNDGKDSYIFKENGDFTFKYIDSNGFEGLTTAIVTNIDKTPPEGAVTQEIVDKQVVVKIDLNEPVVAIEGWSVSEDGLSITKTYSVDANENITLTDNVGNTSTIQFVVDIDTEAPSITGVEKDKLYVQAVTPIIEDENLDIIKLLKNETEVPNYTSGTPIIESGKYVLTAIDKFQNETTVNFDIDVSGVIISISDIIQVTENEIVGEETKPIVRITRPKTTMAQIIENIKSEMSYSILNTEEKNVFLGKKQIGTGYQIEMESGKRYTFIVYGDITGDGEISISELAVASRIASNPGTEIDKIKFMAMDVSKDGKIMVPDLAALSRLRNTY